MNRFLLLICLLAMIVTASFSQQLLLAFLAKSKGNLAKFFPQEGMNFVSAI